MSEDHLLSPTTQLAWTRHAAPSRRMSVKSHVHPSDCALRLEILTGGVAEPCARHSFGEGAHPPKNVCPARISPAPLRRSSVAWSHLSSKASPFVALKLRSASRDNWP